MSPKIENADIFGSEFTLKVSKEKEKHRTKLGAVISIICLIIAIFGIVNFAKNYLDTKNPKITISKQTSNQYPKINLVDQKFMQIYTMVGRTDLLPYTEMNKYITATVQKVEIKINPQTKKSEKKIVKTQKFVDCRTTIIENQEEFEQMLEQSGAKLYLKFGYLLCPENNFDRELFEIEGSINNLPYSYISIKIYPCSLQNPADCAPVQDLAERHSVLAQGFKDFLLDNKKNPVQLIFEVDRMNLVLNPLTYNVVSLQFKKVRVVDEDRDFSEAELNKEFFTVGYSDIYEKFRDGSFYCTENQIFNGECVPFSEMLISSGPEIVTVTRVYNKFFNMISEFGGFIDIVFITLGFFVFFYNGFYLKRFIVKEFIKENGEEFEEFIGEKKIGKEKLDKIKEDFFEEKLTSLNFMKNMAIVEGISKAVLDKNFSTVVEILPFLKKVSAQENSILRKNYDEKNKYSRKNIMELIEKILGKNPKNDYEDMIQTYLKKLISDLDESEINGLKKLNLHEVENLGE